MSIKGYSASSYHWLQERFNDKYINQAKERGLRSRAWFKLAEIQQKDKLFRSGMTVIDLGSSPGGWSQYVVTQIGCKGLIIACDIIPMNPIAGVNFLQGDFSDPIVSKKLLQFTGKKGAQVLLSDMMPNISGKSEIDIPRFMHLAELALDICQIILACGGSFLIKVLQGRGLDIFLRQISSLFMKVKIRKPDSSRARSRELYIVATGYKL